MSDLISRDEAIKAIRKCKFESVMPKYWYIGMETAQDIVDKVPSAETSQNLAKPNNDLTGSDFIRRSDAMGAVQDHFNADGFNGYDDGQQMMDRLNALPSAETSTVSDKHQLSEETSTNLSAEARPIQTRNCDGCDIFTMAEELAMASIEACADEIVRQIKDSRVECKDCKHHHTSEMYEYCDLVAVKGRKQRVMKYCSLGERREP